MILRRARSVLGLLAVGVAALAPSACQPAPRATTRPAPVESKPVKTLPPRATIALDDLSPAIERPLSKPYTRRLPAGAAKAIRQARKLQNQKNHAGAVEQLQRALDFDPQNPHTRKLLGMAQLALPNYGEALKNLQAAGEYLADDVQLQILLGQLHRNLQQPDQAVLHFRTALQCSNAKPSNPQSAYALLALSHLLEDQGYWTAALECLTTLQTWVQEHGRAYESNPLLESLLFRPEKLKAMRGRLLAKLLRHDEAIPLLQNAYHRNRSDAQTAGWLFEALLEDKQFSPAETMLVELASSGPLRGLAPTLAKELCRISDDKTLPSRLWKQLRDDEEISTPLAISLAQMSRQQGRPREAMAILEDLLKAAPHHTEGVRLLVELSIETGDRVRALRLLANLIQANPQSPDAVIAGVKAVAGKNTDPNLLETFSEQTYRDASKEKYALHYVAGLLGLEENQPLKAADHFRRAIREKEDFYPAYDALLDLHLRAKDTEALQVLLDLCKDVAQEEYYYNYLLGRARLSEGKPDQAIDALEEARKKNASHVPTLLTLAKAYRMQADLSRDPDVRSMFRKQAASVLQKAIRLTPDAADVHRALFDLYLEQNDTAKALETARTLMNRQPDRPDGALMQAEALLHAGKLDQARAVLQLLVRKYPDHPTIQLLAIQAILKRFPGVLPRPVFDQTVDRLRELRKQHPEDEKILRFLAQLLSQVVPGYYDQAADAWAEIVKLDPNDSKASETLAMMRLQAGQYPKALRRVRRLRKTSPKDTTLRLMESDALLKAGRPDEAIQLVRSWWDQDKTNPDWVMLLLDLFRETHRYKDALNLLADIETNASNLLPKDVRASRQIAFLCRAGRYDEAVVLAKQSDTPLGYAVLADKLADANQYDLLLPALKTAQANETDAAKQSHLRDNLIYALGRARRHSRAVELIDEWIRDIEQTQPRPADAISRLAKWRDSAVRLLLAAGFLDEAESRLKTYLANDPNNAELHNLQSTLLTERQQDDQALRELQRARKLQPKDPSYQNNLAYLLAQRGEMLPQAERLIRAALQIDGPRPTTADTLAWVYYKQGRLGESAEVLVSVLPETTDSEPRGGDEEEEIHPVIWDHAGDVFYRLGWADRAVRYWKQAIRGAKDEPYAAREIREILRNTPAKLRAVEDRKLPAVAPLGKEVQSSIEKKLREYEQQHPTTAPTTQPARKNNP
ncbi:MAG: tetratricopeptide repeat protein [Phycisphaerae bacterium]|nr:tetratricopeptide repeat protein [Phycisphaerae bacterium]